MKITKLLAGSAFLFIGLNGMSQGTISGNMESNFQYLNDDEKINAIQPDEKALLNSYINVNYRNSGFKAGMRLEAYLPSILGYPDRFDGAGLGYRYVGYENELVDVTVGNFYDQFGSGLIFRSYEDRALGFDNMMNGISLKLRPYKGVTIKTVYGRQRYSFTDGKNQYGAGIVRGADLEINFSQWFPKLAESDFRVTGGGSFVSRYQEDDNTQFVLPENTGAYGGRLNLAYKKFFINGEYTIKEQDPSQDNGYIYNYGKGIIVNAGYSQKGLGILLSAKSIDNMSFRSDRNAILQDLTIGFVPPLTKTHTYNLAATLYPYASQPNGEVAFQADIIYNIKRGSLLGGKYGTDIALNFSTAYEPLKRLSGINPGDSTRVTYESKIFDKSDLLYWRDINVNIKRKLTKKWTVEGSYFNISMNNDVLKLTNEKGIIQSHIGVLDVQYKINRKHTVRAELQGLWTVDNKDRGSWATALIEYTISPDWFFSAILQSNYGNPIEEDRINYPMVFVGKIWGATRVQVGYGRQNEGLFCVGGICRFVPASNGLTASFTHSF
ncbi:hypothetical protein ERX46_08800 [Brumimicrobium glaciale]|uniref:Uncharacterized protein n=1 Tax=Brumimicrobium glaciale TaxID=200475 RepID=A0A4Q4KM47_9FLAO|nr:DUF6029 family protein [Brumimicrobium glaciale]RYM34050.1 hypothetical protein ERX46_08800 [Brumimicrobium glaciale]